MKIILLAIFIALLTSSNALPAEPILTQTHTFFINFTDASDNEDGFNLWQCVGVGCEPNYKIRSPIAASPGVGSKIQIVDTIVNDPGERTICYNVTAFNSAGESPRSKTACGITPKIDKKLIVPNIPTEASVTSGGTTIP